MADHQDEDERRLSGLAKRMLATPPKPREELKIGRHKPEGASKASRKKANPGTPEDTHGRR